MQLVDLMGAFITTVLKGKHIKLSVDQTGVRVANAEFFLLSDIVSIATALFIFDDNYSI